MLEDRAKPARAGAPLQRQVGDGFEGLRFDDQLDTVHREHLLELSHQGVLRLGQHGDQHRAVELLDRTDDGEATDELGDEAELDHVLGQHVAEEFDVALAFGLNGLVKAH